MFVRFRRGRRRLALSLVETRRLGGRVRHEHIATLGSVETPLTIRSRIAFWARLDERLAKLGNRLGPEDQSRIMDAIHARVPLPTLDDQRELKLENARAEERTWSSLVDMNAASGQGHERLSAKAKAAAERAKARAQEAQAQAAEASERIERLERGDDVLVGFKKPPDFEQVLRAAGWTTRDIVAATRLAEVGGVLGRDFTIGKIIEGQAKASEREGRRIVRRMEKLIAAHFDEMETDPEKMRLTSEARRKT